MTRPFRGIDAAISHLRNIEGYTPGTQPRQEEVWVKLNTNENPFPPSPRVKAAMIKAIGEQGDRLRRYPDPSSATLREALARTHALPSSDWVTMGNGSDDILNLLVRCFSDRTQSVGFTVPGYSLYSVLAKVQGAPCIELELGRDMVLDPREVAATGATIFFLTTPHTPTGVGFSKKTLATILKTFKGLLVVDEAYASFAKEEVLSFVTHYSNLCVVRTFSKSHGLAGLRIGYGLACPKVIRLLDTVRDSYNINYLAQIAALAALQDTAYYQSTTARIRHIRDNSVKNFRDRGWFTYPSEANFIFTEPVGSGGNTGPEVTQALYEYLRAHNILIRYFPGHVLTERFVRITVGDEPSMKVLFQSIDSWRNSV